MGYLVDSLFRKDMSATANPGAATGDSASTALSAEVARIFANDIRAGSISPKDTRHVGQVVAQHTGISQADVEKRVTETFIKVQTKLKDARSAARDATEKHARHLLTQRSGCSFLCSSARSWPAWLRLTTAVAAICDRQFNSKEIHMRSLLLLFLGIPVPIDHSDRAARALTTTTRRN